MEMMFPLMLALAVLLWYLNRFSADRKIDEYIEQRRGTFVSQKREYFDLYSLFSKNTSAYKLVYYDKHKKLRAVLVRISRYGSVEFTGDHEMSGNDKMYFVEREPERVSKKEEHVELVDYRYKSNKGLLIIKQSFYQPNKGEEAFLYDEPAPDGKYKIGFMNYIVVENGKVKELTML